MSTYRPLTVFKPTIQEDGSLRISKRHFSIWLMNYPEWHWYYCPDCSARLFKYKGNIVAEIPGELPESFPVEVICPNTTCRRAVLIQGTVL